MDVKTVDSIQRKTFKERKRLRRESCELERCETRFSALEHAVLGFGINRSAVTLQCPQASCGGARCMRDEMKSNNPNHAYPVSWIPLVRRSTLNSHIILPPPTDNFGQLIGLPSSQRARTSERYARYLFGVDTFLQPQA